MAASATRCASAQRSWTRAARAATHCHALPRNRRKSGCGESTVRLPRPKPSLSNRITTHGAALRTEPHSPAALHRTAARLPNGPAARRLISAGKSAGRCITSPTLRSSSYLKLPLRLALEGGCVAVGHGKVRGYTSAAGARRASSITRTTARPRRITRTLRSSPVALRGRLIGAADID